MATTDLKINFKNYNENYQADGEVLGISIYNQRYGIEEDNIKSKSSQELIEVLKKCITGNMKVLPQVSSELFGNINWEKRDDNAFVIPKNYILPFRCTYENGEDDVVIYSYYCYFKDSKGNSWLIYIIDEENYPVVFDLQENVEPVLTLDTPVQAEGGYTGKITSISTGNFYIGQNENGALEYENIELKNTTFNLPTDQEKETPVTIVPLDAITADTA